MHVRPGGWAGGRAGRREGDLGLEERGRVLRKPVKPGGACQIGCGMSAMGAHGPKVMGVGVSGGGGVGVGVGGGVGALLPLFTVTSVLCLSQYQWPPASSPMEGLRGM